MKQPSKHCWQGEREKRLHRACQLIRTAVSRGETVRHAARRMAGRYHNRPYKCEARRRMTLHWTTLRKHFYQWKKGGELAAVFQLKYRKAQSVFKAWMLIRFLNFIVERRHASMKAAFESFSRHGRGFTGGQRGAKPPEISYGQLCYHFPAKHFYLIREQQAARDRAQRRLVELQTGITSELQQRFPDRRPRPRTKRGNDFQI